jgi:hypothetical protein
MQVASNGNAVAYLAEATTAGNGSSTEGTGNQYLATRGPDGGWTQTNIQPNNYITAIYQAFSTNLSQAILIGGGEEVTPLPPFSPEAPEGYESLFQYNTSGGSYQPLFTKAVSLHRSKNGFVQIYAGSSSDFDQQFFEANDALTSNAVDDGGEINLYESVGAQLSLVNVLPNGTTEPNATFGMSSDFSHVVSSNGSRVFWTDLNTTVDPEDPSGETRLFMRENPDAPQSPVSGGACTVATDACTIEVDGSVGGGGRFWTASADGSRVFFTKGPLYEYDVEDGQTTDLSEGHNVEGVLGVSEDGSYVYFVEEGFGLYVSHDTETPKLIATLSGKDGQETIAPYSRGCNCGSVGDWQSFIGRRTSQVSANGSAVAFMSSQELTGYNNEGLEEVYVYEAEDGGRVFCISCNYSGEPPQTEDVPESVQFGAAAFLPISHEATFVSQFVSDDGARVFFDSGEPLVPKDTNGKQDVYEWERDGTGSCHEIKGCIYLLSGGNGKYNSWFLGADASGENVFIVTRTPLLNEGQGEEYALYDARVDGVLPLSPPACTGTGCQGVPAPPPTFATPPSVTFEGVGNFPPSTPTGSVVKPRKKTLTRAQKLAQALKICRKESKKRKTSCEARAKKRYGAKRRAKSTTAKGRQ